MKVLLIGDGEEIQNLVRAELEGRRATLKIVRSVRAAESYMQKERPEVVVFGLMDEGNSITPDQIRLPANYEVNNDFFQFDLSSRSLSKVGAESVAYFVKNLPMLETREVTSSLLIQGGKVVLAESSRPSKQIASKARVAREALREAKEALAAIVSFEEDPLLVGNRVPAPLTKEVIDTIAHVLDAGIASTQAPTIGKEIVGHWKATAAFLKDAERVVRQLEKTATAGIKAAGVLGVLAAALGAAALKLKDLLAALGFGG